MEVEGRPGSFVVEGGVADGDYGADGAIGLFFLEVCAETVDAGVAVKPERTRVLGDGVPVRVDRDREDGEFVEGLADDVFHFWGEDEPNTWLQHCVDGTEPNGNILEKFALVPDTS